MKPNCRRSLSHLSHQKEVEKTQEKHQNVIEEKDATLAFINDDLQDHDNQIKAIQCETVALQAQRDVYQTQLQTCEDTINHLKTRHVDHARNPSKDNIIIIVRKQLYHDLTYTYVEYNDIKDIKC